MQLFNDIASSGLNDREPSSRIGDRSFDFVALLIDSWRDGAKEGDF